MGKLRAFMESPALRPAVWAMGPLGLSLLLSVATAAVALSVHDAAGVHVATAQARYKEARATQREQQVMRRTAAELAAFWQRLPQRKEFPDVILHISELAREEHVQIPGITYAVQKGDESLAIQAALKFEAFGEYAAIREFIQRLETAGPYLVIESLDASRTRDREGQARQKDPVSSVLVHMHVITFLRPDATRGAT